MKVLFVNPRYPTIYYNNQKGILLINRKRQPLSILYSATLLKKDGFEVEILDANALEMGINETRNFILRRNPDVLVLSTQSFDLWQCPIPDYRYALDVVKDIKKECDLFIIVVGPHGTSNPEEILNSDMDLIVRGEPELSVFEIVKRLKASASWEEVIGVYTRKVNNGFDYINLDELPVPDYSLLPMDRYYHEFLQKKNFSIVNTTRGCPFNCIFCYKVMYGSVYRRRDLALVLREIELLYKDYNVKAIYFQDLDFVLDRKRVEEICDYIIDEKIDIIWGCTTRVDSVNKNILGKMKRAGCKFISFGAESANPEILEMTKKKITIDKIKKAVMMTNEIGLCSDLNFLIGLPGESVKSYEKSWKFYKSLNPYAIGASIVIPYLDTELHQMAMNSKILKSRSWLECENASGIVGNELDNKTLTRLSRIQTFRGRTWFFKKEFGLLFFINPRFYKLALYILKKVVKEKFSCSKLKL